MVKRGGHKMADEKSSMKMKDINEALSDYQVQSLEGVILEGDIEIEMDISSGAQSLLSQSLGQEFTNLALQLFNFSRSMGYPVDSMNQIMNTGGGTNR
jgi:acetyl-CoA decarbonylase/synthase complex subunit delta